MGLDFNPLDSITKPLEKSLKKDFRGVDEQLEETNKTLNTQLGQLDKDIEQIPKTIGEQFSIIQNDVAEMKKWLVGTESAVEREARAAQREATKDVAFLIAGISLVVFLNSESNMFFTAGALGLALAAYLVL